MLYCLSTIVFVLNLIFYKSKIPFALLLLTLFLMMGFSYGNADFSTYELYFDLFGSNLSISLLTHRNGLFYLLCAVFKSLGFTYFELLLFITLVGLMNLFFVSRFFLNNSNIVFVLYFIYPFIIDITQIRNFLAMSFFLLGLSFLIKETKTSKAVSLFILFNIIASSLHFIFVFYFICIVIVFVNKNTWKFYIIPMIATELLMINYAKRMIGEYTSIDRVDTYFGQHIDITTLIIVILYYLAIIGIISYLYRKHIDSIWIFNLLKVNVLLLTTVPMMYYSFEFMRLFRNIIFLDYIATVFCAFETQTSSAPNNNQLSRKKFKISYDQLLLAAFVVVSLFSFYLFIYHDYSQNVVIPAFEENRLIT